MCGEATLELIQIIHNKRKYKEKIYTKNPRDQDVGWHESRLGCSAMADKSLAPRFEKWKEKGEMKLNE